MAGTPPPRGAGGPARLPRGHRPWGRDVALFLHQGGAVVSIVNPARVSAFAASELARNKTDKLDAGVVARFCRAHAPPPWTPPAEHLRELRDLVRRCEALKAMRVQEINRRKSGAAAAETAASIARAIAWLDGEIAAIAEAIHGLIRREPRLARDFDLLLSIPGVGEVTAALVLAELPEIEEFDRKALAAFAGLSPQEHSSGSSVRRSAPISRRGHARLRSAFYLCALSAKRRNPDLRAFAERLKLAGKPPKVVLTAVARKLLVTAQAVIKHQQPFRTPLDA